MLRGAGTRFATWFYAMMRLLWLKDPLVFTIHQRIFRELDLSASVEASVRDIENPRFWRAIYTLLRAVYPALLALRRCDSSSPSMSKIYYLTHRATTAIQQSMDALNDEELFSDFAQGDFALEEGMVYGGEGEDDDGR